MTLQSVPSPATQAARSDLLEEDFKDLLSWSERPASLENDDAAYVWAETLRRKLSDIERFKNVIPGSYKEAVALSGFRPETIPSLDSLNQWLLQVGWEAVWILGYIPGHVYASLISFGLFPVAGTIRSPNHIDRSPVPDFLLDMWGHWPLLFDSGHSGFLRKLTTAMVVEEPSALVREIHSEQMALAENLRSGMQQFSQEITNRKERLQERKHELRRSLTKNYFFNQIFIWTIEFGFFEHTGGYEVAGAGILSLSLELEAFQVIAHRLLRDVQLRGGLSASVMFA